MHAEVYFQILRSSAVWQVVVHCYLHQILLPMVRFSVTTVTRIRLHLTVLKILFLVCLLFLLSLVSTVPVYNRLYFLLFFFLLLDLLGLLFSDLFYL